MPIRPSFYAASGTACGSRPSSIRRTPPPTRRTASPRWSASPRRWRRWRKRACPCSSTARRPTSGGPPFFLGTDTAPHSADPKECACGCAGIFNAPVALQVYAQVFSEEGALDRLEAFASLNGPRFYGLPPNDERITLRAGSLEAPDRIDVPGGDKSVVVFRPDTPVGWSF